MFRILPFQNGGRDERCFLRRGKDPRKATVGHPARRVCYLFLAGLLARRSALLTCLPGVLRQWPDGGSSLLTVAGTAPGLPLRRRRTGFPLSPRCCDPGNQQPQYAAPQQGGCQGAIEEILSPGRSWRPTGCTVWKTRPITLGTISPARATRQSRPGSGAAFTPLQPDRGGYGFGGLCGLSHALPVSGVRPLSTQAFPVGDRQGGWKLPDDLQKRDS